MELMPAGGPVPEGADAVIQIEDTESISASAAGQSRVKIVKVMPHSPWHLRVMLGRFLQLRACLTCLLLPRLAV